MQIRLHNTLARRVEPLVLADEGRVGMYTCGPTVYRPVHVGNLRSYLLADWLRRAFELFGLHVTSVRNITDVGHMRQDAVDRGEDKVIAAALAEGRSPMQIARSYETVFREDERKLGILPATFYPRASEHVPEMIAMVERLVARDLAYVVDGTVYFAVKRFAPYGRLSGNVGEALRQGVRSEIDPKKHNPADFALWKQAEAGRSALVWHSPWGRGYPGWHIECSAMSVKYLGERFDVHTGGVDNIFPHHEDEIAQSEGSLGHPVVGTWVHGQHLLADGVKMAKSARNTLEVREIESLGIDPLAFRYQCILTHYRARMHFSVAALRQAAEGLDHLRQRVRHWSQLSGGDRNETMRQAWAQLFRAELADDLNLPRAFEVLQLATRSRSLPARSKLELVLEADAVLGLGLDSVARERDDAPAPVLDALSRHARAREEGDYAAADALRASSSALRLEDHARDRTLVARADRRIGRRKRRAIASPLELDDHRSQRPSYDWTVAITTREWPADVERCVRSVLRFAPNAAEILVLDQGSSERTAVRLDALVSADRVKVIHADRDLGEGAGRNALLRVARGRLLLQLDPSVELIGDLFAPLEDALRTAGIAGPWGLRTTDLRHFDEVTTGGCDAIQGYCLATARETLLAIGGFDERYRYYRNLDIAVSLAVREHGGRAVAVGAERALRHAHRAWEALPEDERDKRSRRNHDRMYKRFSRTLASA